MAVASLAVTKSYADNNFLTEAILDTAFQSVQTYTQNYLVNNFNQIKKDAFGNSTTSYDFDNDGNANLTNPLINKQSASISYSSDVVLTATTSAWKLASASLNLRLVPEVPGKYKIDYNFSVESAYITAGAFQSFYAIFNKTAGATLVGTRVGSDATTGAFDDITPIHLSYIHNFSSTAAATFTLYYKVLTSTNVTNHRIKGGESGIIKNPIYGCIYKI